jgi:hypothetical protein
MADIVRATYYVTDASDADARFAVCGEVLGDIRPAATLLVVAGPLQARDEGRDRSHREAAHRLIPPFPKRAAHPFSGDNRFMSPPPRKSTRKFPAPLS